MDCLTGCVIKGRPKEGRLKWSRTARRAGSLHDTGGRRAVTRTPLLFCSRQALSPQRVHALHGIALSGILVVVVRRLFISHVSSSELLRSHRVAVGRAICR